MKKPPLCVACRYEIREGASFCRQCKQHQDWRRHFPISATIVALVGGFIGVIAGIVPAVSYFADQDSSTRFKVASSDMNHIYLKIWNTGRKPSALVGYRLIFNDLPTREVVLDLDKKNKEAANGVIPPGMPIKISLTKPLPTEIGESLAAAQYDDKEIEKALSLKPFADLPVTLEIDVEESNDSEPDLLVLSLVERLNRKCGFCKIAAPRQYHIRHDRFRASRIGEFINGSVRP